MFNLNDRPRQVMDGTYANVPNAHYPIPKIGLREFNNGVLVHNWMESRAEVNFVKISMKYFNIPDLNFILLRSLY